MTTWSRSERTTREVLHTVPAPVPWGACWSEVCGAIDAAVNEYKRMYGQVPADNQIRVHAADGEIAIIFEAAGP